MKQPRAPRKHLPTSPFSPPVAPVIEQYALDDRVTHDKYGLGRIIGVEQNVAVIVDFGQQKVHIKAPYPKLSKL
ncbi:hypothetical protein [Spirillospora sp. NPDC047279]|uniref:hypothetical protein n=1 Tax=Spirillospora sp. NPDC047279 TaxID=3155478 RepID=UPI0033C1C37F